MDKELLKKFLFKNFLGLVKSYNSEIESKDEFYFDFSDDRKDICFNSVIKSVYGGNGWDNTPKEVEEIISDLNQYHINQCLKKLIMSEEEFLALGIEDNALIKDYYDGLTVEFYCESEEERANEDYYFNHDVVRIMKIPVDDMADFILNFKFKLPLNDILSNLDYLDDNVSRELMAEFNAYKLNLSLPMKTESPNKSKI